MFNRNTILSILLLAFQQFFSIPASATQTTYTFYPVGDTFVATTTTGGSQIPNQNEGLNTHLRIQHPSGISHVLLKFSQQSILTAIGTNHVVSANLKLYVETNFNNWGTGATVDVHRLSVDWGETTATWNCHIDTNLGNTSPDCDDVWEGGFYDEYISASSLYQNGQTGWKTYDVTTDIQILQNESDHFGWLIRKRDPAAAGSVDYTSVQGTSLLKPRLEVTVNDQTSCTPTSISSIYPAVIPSDSSNNTITVLGTGLDRITSLSVDNTSAAYTLVNSTTITFTRSYASVAEHEIMFRSNCLADPLENYTLISDTNKFQAQQIECNAPASFTNFSRSVDGRALCWKGDAVRLIGYSGQFSVANWDSWNNSAMQTYFRKAQLKEGSPDGSNRRGFNLF
jgi:hypothetical protein